MSKLGDLGLGNGKRIEEWEYATAALRTAATGFVASDVGKIAFQSDNNSYWRLTAVTPTWAQIGGGGDIQLSITVGLESANSVSVSVQVQDGSAVSITATHVFTMWLSDNAVTGAITGTVPDTDFSLSDGVELFSYVTDKMKEVVTDDTGTLTIDLEHTGVKDWYLYFKMPNGTVAISDKIIFA